MPVADMAQFEFAKCTEKRWIWADGAELREPTIDTSYENAAADYYAKYGTVGEFEKESATARRTNGPKERGKNMATNSTSKLKAKDPKDVSPANRRL